MEGRRSTPEEEAPRRQGGRLAWLVGTVPALAHAAFVVVAVVVLIALVH